MPKTTLKRLGFDENTVEQNSALLRLPHELMEMVLGELDLASLANLTATSRQARFAVRSMPTYREVPSQAPDAIEMLVKTDMLGQCKAADIWRALHSRNCAGCNRAGVLLYLPTCQRMCQECLQTDQAYQMLGEETICAYLSLEPSHLQGLPRFRVPDKPQKIVAKATSRLYRRKRPTAREALQHDAAVRARRELISFEQAMEVALDVHGCDRDHRQVFEANATGPRVETPESPAIYPYASWCPPRPIDPWEESLHPKQKIKPYITLLYMGFENGLYAAAKIPYISPNGEVEQGLSDIIILRNCLMEERLARSAKAKRVKPPPPPRRPWRERHPILSTLIFGP